jgi:hypothetical protein
MILILLNWKRVSGVQKPRRVGDEQRRILVVLSFRRDGFFCMARIPESDLHEGGWSLEIAGHALISNGEERAYAPILPLIGGIAMDPRSRQLEAPVGRTILRLAVPNLAVTMVQASQGLDRS